MIPRNLIISLRQALIYGSLEKCNHIDDEFLVRHHKNMFGGLDNKWEDYKAGKFRYG